MCPALKLIMWLVKTLELKRLIADSLVVYQLVYPGWNKWTLEL